MVNLDATKLQDWQIAQASEESMIPVKQLASEWGVLDQELLPYGHHLGKVDFKLITDRLQKNPRVKYINVTAITPTPLGEGKTTTTIGLVQGLGKRLKKVSGAIRQPSGGPTFNIKGSAAGGGLSQCIPLTPFSLGLTGDIDCVVNAHNLAMVAVTSRLQHEYINNDQFLAKRNLKRLDIDSRNIEMKWVIDYCAQALRNIVIGMGDKMDGFLAQSGFAIAVSSEVMAILSVATSLKDMRERMGRIVVAYNKQGDPITTKDLEVDGAMTAWMVRALNPNLLQTIEGQPVLVHAGPFANIAVGQSSIIADQIALRLSDYHVTESGFGADIGFEKFWNIKCRLSGLKPDCAVVVVTVRALKMHGGGPDVTPGKPLDSAYKEENLELVKKGCENMIAHIEIVKKSGVTPVVCINKFYTDTENEIKLVKKMAESAGARAAVSDHWLKGGEGALDLADAVIDACEEKTDFKFLYEEQEPITKRIDKIAREVYGAKSVTFTPNAMSKIERLEKDETMRDFPVCMVKTHLSLSHDPKIKGRPIGWELPVSDILTYGGAGFIVPVAGGIKLMPGTSSDPAFRRIDVDTETGKVKGLF